MRKMYKKPTTETLEIRVENLMLNVSNGGTPPDEGPAHAPRRGEVIP